MASYRYRAQTPAKELGASINDLEADCIIFSKPGTVGQVTLAHALKTQGKTVIVDVCDDHLGDVTYQDLIRAADFVTCPTEAMAERLLPWADATVIPDPYEFEEVEPHCKGHRLLWFGHGTNLYSLSRILPDLNGWPLTIVSNVPWAVQWSLEEMQRQFPIADMVVLPATADYKSPNRAIESIRQGCFVVAEPHPSLKGIPGIWIGNIKEGIEWARSNTQEANERTKWAQDSIRERYSPATQANAWRSLLARVRPRSTSVAA